MRALLLTLLAVSATAASHPSVSTPTTSPGVRILDTPAPADSAFPQLAADPRGGVFMTWLETLGGGAGHRLRLSHRASRGEWEKPVTVHEGKDFWRNWADFPGLGVFADGSVMVHWLSRSGDSTYDYDIRARISRDEGRTFGESFLVNTDGKQAEHGFVSFTATERGMAVVWLDGRDTKGGSHEGEHTSGGGAMTLRFAEFLSDGSRVRETQLDGKVCDCCQTTVVNTSKGLLAAYRDRSDTELRDISLVRPIEARPTPRLFSNDGWKINACPVNGPALAANGDSVAAVWFTMAGGKARVRAASSRDGGDTFSTAVDVDTAFPVGRVDIASLQGGESLITWLGRGEGGAAELKAARMSASGVLQPAFKVASASMARASGFPRLEVSGEEAVFAWTEIPPAKLEADAAAPPPRVRTAVLSLK